MEKNIKTYRTNIVNIKKERSKYLILSLISLIGILITTFLYLNINEGTNAKKFTFKNNMIVGANQSELELFPELLEGMTAVNKGEDGNYTEVQNPYLVESGWKGFAKDKSNNIWQWVQRFAFRTAFYKKKTTDVKETYSENELELKGYLIGDKFYSKDFTEISNEDEFINSVDAYGIERVILGKNKKISDLEDPHFSLHPSFRRNDSLGNGYWVMIKTDYQGNKENIKDYYLDIKEKYSSEKTGFNSEDTIVNMVNSRVLGALEIYNNKGIDSISGEPKKELLPVASFLYPISDLNAYGTGKYIAEKYKEGDDKNNFGEWVAYPETTEDEKTPQNNYKALKWKRLSLSGDGIVETLGLEAINKKRTKLKNVSNYLAKENPFLYATFDDGSFGTESIYTAKNDVFSGYKLRAMLVAYKKYKENPDKIKITFKSSNENIHLISGDGQLIEKITLTMTKGNVISKEKLDELNIQFEKKNGETYKPEFSINPLGNAFFKDTEILVNPVKTEKVTVKFEQRVLNANGEIEKKIKYSTEVEKGSTINIPTVILDQVSSVDEITWLDGETEEYAKYSHGYVINKNVIFAYKIPDKKIVFKFYSSRDKENATVVTDEHIIPDGPFDGVKPNIPQNMEFLPPANMVFKEWSPDPNLKYKKDQEFLPVFRKLTIEEEAEANNKVILKADFGGALDYPAENTFLIKKGSKINDEENKSVKEKLLYNSFVKPNYVLDDDNSLWYDISFDQPINNHTTIKLQWKQEKIKVKFFKCPEDDDNNEVLKEQEINAGEKATPPSYTDGLPKEITVNGKKKGFSGWDYNLNNPINSGSNRVINGEIKIYPQYDIDINENAKKYTVKFDFNAPSTEIYLPNPSIYLETEIEEGSTIPYIQSVDYPKRRGYIFKGFTPSIYTPITENTTFIAIWEKGNFTGFERTPGSNDQISDNTETGRALTYPDVPSVTKDGKVKITNPNKKNTDKSSEGAKDNVPYTGKKQILYIGSALTTSALFSFVKLWSLNRKIKRNPFIIY